MAPVAPIPRVVAPSEPIATSEDASTLELSLVSLALFTSAVLALIPSTHRQAQNNIGRPSLFITLFSIFFALLALVLTAVALAFGWAHTISLDALATVVFALIPALLSMPLSNIEYAWLRFRMARFKSLSKTYDTFSYASFDPVCNLPKRHSRRPKPLLWLPKRLQWFRRPIIFEEQAQTQEILYVRYFPRRKFILSSVYGWLSSKCVHSIATLEQAASTQLGEKRVRGYCLEHHKHYLLLQNFNESSEVRWFRSVSSATSILARPWLVFLNTKNGAYQALALLLDIIAFGRLVLKHRKEYLKTQITKCTIVRKCLRRTEGVVCRAILDEVGLKDWGSLDVDVSAPSYTFPSWRCKQYGLLFAVIVIRTRIFGEKRYGFKTKLPTLEKTTHDKDKTEDKDKDKDKDKEDDDDLQVTQRIPAQSLLTDLRNLKEDEDYDEDEDQEVVQRLSAQTVLTNLRDFPKDTGQEFERLQRNEVDRWLASWGCIPTEPPVADTPALRKAPGTGEAIAQANLLALGEVTDSSEAAKQEKQKLATATSTGDTGEASEAAEAAAAAEVARLTGAVQAVAAAVMDRR